MSYILRLQEFAFLCRAVGVNQVYGVDNPFKSVDKARLFSVIRRVHNSLEDKNYIESDFSGNTTIPSHLKNTIRCCADCNRAILICGSKINSTNFYVNTDAVVKMSLSDNACTIEHIDKQMLIGEISSLFMFSNNKESAESIETTVFLKELVRIKNLLRSFDEAEVADSKGVRLGTNLSKQLVSAMTGRGKFYSVAVVENNAGAKVFDGISVVETDDEIIILKPCVDNLENAFKIKACTSKEAAMLINKLVCRDLV